MTVNDIINKVNLEILTKFKDSNTDVTDVYISDLLSHVIANCIEGSIWITILTNLNVPAVAHLTGASLVIIPEDITVEENTLKKAESKDILICSSKLTAYELAVKIHEVLSSEE